ncbi:polyprenol monophosphomannose synthase [Bifidobacterium aquikefiricola]|uniref:Polyprenol monophosphomannose synthase n=1 Tax=Bifidobacterium aquikefiricola TaxID=3059038 RepID=A0AB39U967_9BIFI
MPTYNEGENLGPTLAHVFSRNPQVNVVIVDDDSPDGTGRVADFLAQGNSRVHVIHRRAKEGLGPAYIEGFHWGLDRGYDVICEMDMDGSHRAEDLTRMLAVLNRNPAIDLVIGSRRVEGGQTINWSPTRNAISRLGSWYARHMLALPVHDMTAGFRAYKADILRAIDLDGINANGYVFQIDMTRRVAAAGGRIREVPIAFVERTRGESKMTQSIVIEAMLKVTLWGMRRFFRK